MRTHQEGKHVFFFRPPRKRKLLRFLGTIDLLCAAFLLITGLVFAISNLAGTRGAPSIGYAIAYVFFGVITLQVGALMATNDVVVSATSIRSAGPPRRRVKRSDIASIDIVRRDLRKLKRIVPIMSTKDGAKIPLTPLAWSPGMSKVSLTLERQAAMVSEIRDLIGVGGANYVEP